MSTLSPIWLPQLWTPRSGSWWRLPTWFTAGKAQRSSSTGKLKRKSNGKIARNTASVTKCCCATCAPNCTGEVPSAFSVLFSGVDMSGVGNCGITGSLVGPYTLARAGSACQWDYLENPATTITKTGTNRFGISVGFSFTGFFLRATLSQNGGSPVYTLFGNDLAKGQPCWGEYVFTNVNTTFSCSTAPLRGAINGTATITPV